MIRCTQSIIKCNA